jgi:hypothetical protein
VFTTSGRGPSTPAALRNAIDRSVAVAFQLCHGVSGARCPEPAAQPVEVEFLDARVDGEEIEARAKFTYQCHAPGQGCLTAPFSWLLPRARVPRPASADQPLEELLGMSPARKEDGPARRG